MNIAIYLKQKIISFVEENLLNLFSDVPGTGSGQGFHQFSIYNILGPKNIFTRFKTLLHAAQVGLSCIDCHISTSLKQILFKECCDLSIPPPGFPPNNSIAYSNKSTSTLGEIMPRSEFIYWGNLMWKIVDWFSKVCHQVLYCDNDGNALLWAPYLNAIVRPVSPSSLALPSHKGTGRSSSVMATLFNQGSNFMNGVSLESISLETILSRQELTGLCHMIGVQGVRVLDQELINLVIEKV